MNVLKEDRKPSMTPQELAAQECSVPPSQKNWLKKMCGASKGSCLVIHEHPLYSDAHITGEFRKIKGPYTFLNTVPIPTFDSAVNAPIVLRAEMHIRPSIPDMSQTDEFLYHGGDLVDEVVALASLSLGIRLLGGGVSREFGTNDDPYGRPCEWARVPKPAFQLRRGQPILPSVSGSQSMEDLERLETIPQIVPARYVSLVRACKSYQEALWISESDPNLAWLLFVSALETAADDVNNTKSTSAERLRAARPNLARCLEEVGGRKHLEMVADEVAHTLQSTKKFIDFVVKFAPRVPKERPKEKWLGLNWSKSNLKKVFQKVYHYRSRALHMGVPFPAPMFDPPFVMHAKGSGSEVPFVGLGSYSPRGHMDSKGCSSQSSHFPLHH